MNMDTGEERDRDESVESDETLAQLLKNAGRRDVPDTETTRAVYEAVRAEWTAAVARQSVVRRRKSLAVAMAASIAAVAVAVGIWTQTLPAAAVARITRVEGAAVVSPGSAALAGLELKAGDVLTTNDSARAALELGPGLEVRVDHNTDLLLTSNGEIELRRGAVYVDAGSEPRTSAQRLAVTTVHGVVRHLGTRYEVRVLSDGLRIGVREGRVELTTRNAAVQGAAGELIELTGAGNVTRMQLAADAADWQWVRAIAPEFVIDQRSLSDFLAWVERELGVQVEFATPASEAESARVTLRGSVAGLTPEEAVQAVLATTNLRAERLPGRIVIRHQQ